MNKKLLGIVISLVLVVSLFVGGTIAYLTDRDSEANVFTVGNVEIDLIEKYEQNSTLLPGQNIDKDVQIENTGLNDAWVWFTYAIPTSLDGGADASANVIHANFPGANWLGYQNNQNYWAEGQTEATPESKCWIVDYTTYTDVINGVNYTVYVHLYNGILPVGETTTVGLTNVYMDANIDIDPNGEWYHVLNGEVDGPYWNATENGNPVMYVSAYAIQAAGFETVQAAYDAYQAQWGENGAEYAPVAVNASTADAIEEALNYSSEITLTDSVEMTAGTDINYDTVIELNNNTLTSTYIEANSSELTISNGDLVSGTSTDYGVIAVADSEVVLNDVDITSGGGGIGAADGAKVTVNGGSVAVNTASTSGRYNIYAEGEDTVVTINGGEYSFSKTLNQKRAYIYAGAGTTVYVNGGNFGPASTRSGYTAGILGDGTVIITGGTFGFDPSAWVAEGYVATKTDSTWTVAPVVAE